MKKNVLTYGVIIGIILCINMFFMLQLIYSDPDFKGNDVLGYAALLVMFSLVYFGIRNYRNKELGGYISFGKAFQTGALIALVASTLYVVVWLFYYYLFVPDFLDVYIDHVLRQSADSEIAAKSTQMESFKELYKNPFFVILITYFEVLPIGLVVALISAFFLKKKAVEV